VSAALAAAVPYLGVLEGEDSLANSVSAALAAAVPYEETEGGARKVAVHVPVGLRPVGRAFSKAAPGFYAHMRIATAGRAALVEP